MMQGMGSGMGGGMWFGWLFWIVLIGLVIWGVKAVLDSQRTTKPNLPQEDSAIEILKRRYAKGEIDEDEYEKGREMLM
ncbi:MAG: SHOCT domain-containing protein [Calditrichaeota bacterium]|nr:MAG: SHOCT domain-containing protein [Calditrichota bacterium]